MPPPDDPAPLRSGPPRAAPPLVHTARIDPGGERGRGAWFLIVAALALVAVAILKPWDVGRSVPGGVPGSSPAAPTVRVVGPAPPSSAPILNADEIATSRCNRPLGWRTYTFETWNGRRIRTWTALEPLAATDVEGALDRRIPVVPAIGEVITAIGYCAPSAADSRPPPGVRVLVWAVAPSGVVRALEPRRIEPALASSLSALFAYPDASGRRGGPAPWPDGRYLFAILGPAPGDYGRWFAVDVVNVGAPPSTP